MPERIFQAGKGTKLIVRLTPDESGEYGSGLYFGRDLMPEEKIEVQHHVLNAAAKWFEKRSKK